MRKSNQVESTPRERRQQRTQHAIIEAARQIIRETGIEGLSIRAIADRIDYSPAGLYEYFGSKEEIVAAVCAQDFERFAKRLAQVDKTLAPADYMLELGLAYIDFAVHNADSFLLMFTTFPLLRVGQQEPTHVDVEGIIDDDAFSILLRGVQRCVDEGIYRIKPDFGVFEMAYASWAQVHGLAMLRITSSSQMHLHYATVERETLRTFGYGLAHV
jgi:AcrR family transcriptional regulator